MADDLDGGSPVDDQPFPDQLSAHVVDVGDAPRIHGYDVCGDLVHHYSLAEVMLLSMTGEAPDRDAGKAFEVALIALMPLSVAEAPVHAATLASILGSGAAAQTSIAAIGLAECVQVEIAANRSRSNEERQLADLRAALPAAYRDRCKDASSVLEACLGVLEHCGVTDPDHLVASLTATRLVCAVAEASAHSAGTMRAYPTKTAPAFRYEEP